MRILVVNNLYPPYHLTGYELGCRDVVESLKARGHQVRVLTSRYCFKQEFIEGGVYRWLRPGFKDTLDWRTVLIKELVNQTAFKKVCRDMRPEVVLFFNLTHISASLGLLAQEMALPASYYLSNHWFAIWERDHWSRVWPKGKEGFRVLRYFSRRYGLLPPEQPLRFGQAIFTNSYLWDLARRMNSPISQASVIPWGIDVSRFSLKKASDQPPSRLLWAGQLLPRKSIETAIKALGILKRDYGYDSLSLTIVGDEPTSLKSLYLASLQDLVETTGLQGQVRFQRRTAREDMPSVYQAHDILILPSGDGGAPSLALLEAMSCGLGIVSTAARGHAEILKDGENALIFPTEDPVRCAQQVLRLLRDPALYNSIRARARKTIEEGFRLEKSVEAIEAVLERATRQTTPAGQLRTAEKNQLLKDRHPEKSLSELAQGAKKRLRLGAAAVAVRTVARPRFFIRKGKRAVYKAVSMGALLILPVFYEAFFRLAGRRPKPAGGGVQNIKSVLVIQPADMGDVLLSGPFLRELRRLMPEAWIGLVVQPAMFDLVEKCPYVDKVILFRWRSFQNWGNAFSGHLRWWLQTTWLTARRLWKHQVDMAVSLRWNNDAPQAAAITLMFTSGAPQRVGYLDIPYDRIPYRATDINRLITRGPVRTFLKHETELQLEILSSLGAKPANAALEVWTGSEDEAVAGDLLRRAGLSENDLLIAFAPGAAWSYRRWPAERFIALGQWLQETYRAHILIFAARGELELAGRIERGLEKARTLNLAAQTTLRQMAAVLRHCRLFIGNDSGPIHLAAGAGVPVVGLYGPGEFERFRPWGRDHEAIRLGLPCSPCSQNCVFADPRCIRGISVDMVKEVIAKKLESLLKK